MKINYRANKDSLIAQTAALLTHYGFEMRGYTAQELINQWLIHYQAMWVRLAVVEALYQGRYKAVSVEQILYFWLRRGNPTFHFNHDFERLICCKLPKYSHKSLKSVDNLSPVDDLFDLDLISLSNSSDALLSNPEALDSNQENIPREEDRGEHKPINEQYIPSFAVKSPQISTLASLPPQINHAVEKIESELSLDINSSEAESYQELTVLAPENNIKSLNITVSSPIHQFKPKLDASDLYYKLKAVAGQNLESKDEPG